MPNTELLARTLAHIEANPHEWNQSMWASRRTDCGTAYCFAGTAVHLGRPDLKPDFVGENANGYMRDADGELIDIRDEAIEQLDLPEDIADHLFSASNDLDDLRWMVGNLVAGRDVFHEAAVGGA